MFKSLHKLKIIIIVLFVAVQLVYSQSSETSGNWQFRSKDMQWIQLGYSSNIAGYEVNRALNKVFWAGRVHVKQGFMLNYQQNLLYYKKFFAIDWGLNAAIWQTAGKHHDLNWPMEYFPEERFFTCSVFPVFRLNFVHTPKFESYIYYAIGGPSFISKTVLDNYALGKHFIFLDNMGLAAFFGNNKQYNVELRIGHYSNAELFPQNHGVKVPLTMLIGYKL